MRVGIFSDIHGNIYAFDKVWKALLKESCDMYCCGGDLCGYYYSQDEVIDAVQNIDNLICIKGNHDKIFLNCLENEEVLGKYSNRYGGSLAYLKSTITRDHLEFLKDLPLSFEDKELGLTMFHGSPWDALNDYVYPTDSVDKFKDLDFKYIFLGHTHYPMHKQVRNVQIINPGSVGQPRDCSQASFAVLDLDKNILKFKRVDYDIDSLRNDLKRHNEQNEYLFSVLNRKESE
ncbi:MAG: metallophosphoesterase family protein [Candidatus Omnitrophica bacterium]|nr:metallophosphoesterase family protein [Candidatus Omnitrophota bacterium]